MRLFRIHPVVLMLCAGLAACQDGGGYGQPQASNEPVYQIYPNPDDPDSVPVYVPQSQLHAYYNGQGAGPEAGGSDDSQQQAYQQEMMRQQQERAQQEQQQWFEQNYGAPGQ
ncbi:hypothetical protein AB4Z01_28765 [Inquilinus sp. YAF38]|uniref:hypothetical protein n=1 Tax=Inquilinus sp. YAF38 TaxID=3233084 RepID=UPI003F8FFA87